ncbi:type II toxin-antitoxin system YafQ family toxin [Tetragenococcus halophilus]|uniref:type II toxin-antitoxin system YafQ family toxin n=1 Tax=Tetragenococcus halophilus TaxID=51669 RepID=UPI001F27C380|nr:type II toxin-antitoxin system YafQ family toxin [Tetragenococcus halophilus]MCF1685732.1 type II toxin-antitoxin system YafQ family toxin [Tetragenococcus halophilus]
MKKLKFKPRSTFNVDLKRLASIDWTIIAEVREAVDLLLETGKLPEEFGDHELSRRMAGYYEFHLRDTPQEKQPNEVNDVLVVYTIDENELILISVRDGLHDYLCPGQNSSAGYHKK